MLVTRAKSRILTERYERHHIIPKSIGGLNDDENIVRLTLREHFVCHKLLTKMTSGRHKYQMEKAAYCMMFLRKNQLILKGSRTFEFLKLRHAIAQSKLLSGTKRSEASKQRNREAGFRRAKPSAETKLKISKANKGQKRSQETKDRISKANLGRVGKPLTDAQRRHLSNMLKGRPSHRRGMEPWNKGVRHSEESIAKMVRGHANRPTVTCPHCQKTMQKPNFAAWHGERCKSRVI